LTLTQTEAFALTLVTEGIAAAVLARSFNVKPWRAAAAAVIGSTISHPILWPATLALYSRLGLMTVPLLEILVALFESIAYRLIVTKSWRTALVLSAIVNFLSWLVGFFLQRTG